MVDYSNIPRDSRRVPLETRVQFKFDRFDGFISEYSANISPGGLFLRTRVPQPPGTVLDFEFRLGDGFELIRGRGEVVWNRLEDEGAARPAGMGLRFQSLSEGSKELIYRIVDQHILHGGTPFDVTQHPPDPVPLPPPPAPVPVPMTPPPPPSIAATSSAASAPGPVAVPWPRPAPAPAAEREVFDLSPPLSTPDASSWLPALDDGGAAGTRRLPERFPQAAEEPAPAEAPPMFAATFGPAAARPPRRKLPWILLAAGVLVAAALFLLRDQVMGWVGLGGDEAVAQATPPAPRHPKGPRRARTGVPVAVPASAPPSAASTTPGTTDLAASGPPPAPLVSDASAAPGKVPAAATTSSTAAAPAQTAPVAKAPPVTPPAPSPLAPPVKAASGPAPKAAPFPAVQEDTGTPLTAVEKITFEAAGGGTDVILWGNGAIPSSVYTQSRIDGNPPRELFRLSGIRQPFAKARIVVGTPEVLQIRTGIHSGAHGNELHVVLDLAHPNVTVTQVEAGPQRLRIHLQRK
jgi:molecular chaperone DnaK